MTIESLHADNVWTAWLVAATVFGSTPAMLLGFFASRRLLARRRAARVKS